jgi:hypothetical protein
MLFGLFVRFAAVHVAVFDEDDDLAADVEVSPREIAVAVINAQASLVAFILLPAGAKLLDDPRGHAIFVPHLPAIAAPLDIVLEAVRKELLLYLLDETIDPALFSHGFSLPSNADRTGDPLRERRKEPFQ